MNNTTARSKNLIVKATKRVTALLVMSTLSAVSLAAPVTSIAPETFAQYGKENAFWEASVSCADVDAPRVIQRKTDGEVWCPKGAANLCDASKDKAAANACGDEYSSLIEQDSRAKEQEEQAEIARQKAEQEQQRRRQQEELRRQQAAAAKPKPRPTISADEVKLRNKISIQEARIKLDQEKLVLRRRELALERRALEIEDILATFEE